MNKELILEKVNQIFRKVFDEENIVINYSSSAMDIEEWDSLNNIQIIIAVEKEFKIRISYLESPTLTNKNKIVSFIKNKVNS